MAGSNMMNALYGNALGGMLPHAPQQGGMMNALGGMNDWRALRPDHPQFGQMTRDARQSAMTDWRSAMHAWRLQWPGFGGGMGGGAGGGIPPVTTGQPPVNPGPMPVNPYAYQTPANMVGSSYAVPSMTMPTSGFGLPGY